MLTRLFSGAPTRFCGRLVAGLLFSMALAPLSVSAQSSQHTTNQTGTESTGSSRTTISSTPDNNGESALVLQPILVTARRVANLQPASSYATLATALRYDPQIDLQSRGLPEGQADITVRGGVFENTGFRLGAVTIFDPQTGHYAVELPIDPTFLSAPRLLTDSDNAAASFNASVATVQYELAPMRPGNSLYAGVGSNGLLHGRLAGSFSLKQQGERKSSLGISAAASRGDGTVPFGDHDFKRLTGQYEVLNGDAESRVLLGYQDKFYGWPGAYTGFASLPETDHTRLGLLVLDHKRLLQQGWWQATAAYRWLEDDYDFDRRTPDLGGPGSFEHKTRNVALGVAGEISSGKLDWTFSGQVSADHLVRSTDLTGGDFNSRNYLSLALVPKRSWSLFEDTELVVKAGLRADISNRDKDVLMPVAGIRWEQIQSTTSSWLGLEYSRNSQLAGYTALKSPPRGLFGGNPNLGRAFANTVTLSAGWEQQHWLLQTALFHRKDDNLVDWTYRQGAPFVRQANAVDLNVNGFELMATWQSERLDAVFAYTALDKDADYGPAAVDASYYALNYAQHRTSLALLFRPSELLEFRLDNEYRQQQENSLRSSSSYAYSGAVSLSWQPVLARDLWLALVVDNWTDSDFQEFPGTPPSGRQLSVSMGLDW